MEPLRYFAHAAHEWFWDDRFWLPGNVTWADLKSTDRLRYPNSDWDIMIPIPVAFALLTIRYLFERFIASPIGRSYGLREGPSRRPPDHPQLESSFRSCPKPSETQVSKLAREVGWTSTKVEWWLRLRRNHNRPSALKKCNESCWKFVYYLSAFLYGLIVLYDKPWFYDTTNCWENYPFHPLQTEIYWYYMIEAGFYLSLTFSHFYDTKRKDFYQMFIHHITTLLLLYFSWCCNMVRAGTLVLVIHDAADWLMEGAKVAKYCRLQKLCDVMFGVFTVTWFISRLVLYPLRCLHTVLIEAPRIIGPYSSMYLFSGLLCVLQVMHVIWFYMICRIAYTAIMAGEVQKDDRSSSEESEVEVNDKVNGKSHRSHKNHSINNIIKDKEK